jgi:cation transport ATPase-like protein
LAPLPLVLGLPIIFDPIHIAVLELVIDSVCSLVFEAEKEEDDVMRRPPRSPTEPQLSPRLAAWGALQGTLAFAMVGGIFVFALRNGLPDGEARALTFVTLVLGIFSLILVNRSFSPSLRLALVRPNVALVSIPARRLRGTWPKPDRTASARAFPVRQTASRRSGADDGVRAADSGRTGTVQASMAYASGRIPGYQRWAISSVI